MLPLSQFYHSFKINYNTFSSQRFKDKEADLTLSFHFGIVIAYVLHNPLKGCHNALSEIYLAGIYNLIFNI